MPMIGGGGRSEAWLRYREYRKLQHLLPFAQLLIIMSLVKARHAEPNEVRISKACHH